MKTYLKHSLFLLLLVLPLQAQSASDYRAIMADLIQRGDQLSSDYSPGQALVFGNQYSQLYFGHFEGQGLEFAVGQADNDAMLAIEIQFSRLINTAMTGQPKPEIDAQWQGLRQQLSSAPMLESGGASFAELVVQSLLILLREGIEALLVIAALIAYLRKAGAADRVYLIWLGSLAALGASVLTAIALHKLIQNSGAARETLEGVTMLIAAILLSYVSVWLFARREMQQWQGFIQDRLGSAVSGGSLWAIVSVAFFAVYREGAETILFYQALVGDAEGQWHAIATGFGLAVIALLIVYLLIFQLSVRLPLKHFFTGTAALLYVLSVIFTGKAVLELQVAGWLGNSYLASVPTISWLGLFPSLQSILSQLVMILLPVLGWLLIRLRSSQASAIDTEVTSRPI
ncbi:FTR1 family iron permease [Pontibacterium sp. N1Y112]|uniref:FTR1 family iron permease n=1 Tax=Pontibacterium sinense TaxID=2781979 RepID=A0A8J7FM79_9GAMM|nr:FTR1 family protein [Pontibacterium sinense]MBE9398848.1 FTR1 family iron permease [Pontibacterium sinense]